MIPTLKDIAAKSGNSGPPKKKVVSALAARLQAQYESGEPATPVTPAAGELDDEVDGPPTPRTGGRSRGSAAKALQKAADATAQGLGFMQAQAEAALLREKRKSEEIQQREEGRKRRFEEAKQLKEMELQALKLQVELMRGNAYAQMPPRSPLRPANYLPRP